MDEKTAGEQAASEKAVDEEKRTDIGRRSSGEPDARPAVVVLCSDMMTAIRIQDTVERADGRTVIIDDLADPMAALGIVDRSLPVLALVDLAVDGDWETVVRRCKLRPHTRHIPMYAFGSHVDTETLRSARAAGVDHAWARSRMMEELADVVSTHVHPAVRYPEGWDDELSELARRGILEFNKGDYFEQHEYFEEAWMAETRPIREMYQGILQIGVAFYHIEQGNWSGALKLFRRGLPKLRDLPAVCQGVRIGVFRRESERIHVEITQLGAARLHEFDRNMFPKIEIVDEGSGTRPRQTDN